MILWNEDVRDFKDFKNLVDKNYYYKLIMKKLKAWKG